MEPVALRKFPYPFKAAVAICSDIDGTKLADKFLAIHQYLNTDRETALGPGLNLEIGDSFFPLTDDDSFSFLSSRPRDRAIIRDFIHAGYIDSMHTYGDGIGSRDDIERSLDALADDGCRIRVWIDHSRAPTNLGKYRLAGDGDVADSPAYHADISLAFGFRFCWLGRVTDIVGQDTPLTIGSLTRVFDPFHPWDSGVNLAKISAKIGLAELGKARYDMFADNRLMRIVRLADGQEVYEFMRCNNHWSKRHARAAKLDYMLRPRVLRDLRDSGGSMIIYTHLGYGYFPHSFPESTQAALRNLSEHHHAGDICVTTTSRLLTYRLVHDCLDWTWQPMPNGVIHINIRKVMDPVFGPRVPSLEELQGISFYVPDRHRAHIDIGEQPVSRIERNPQDHTGRQSVAIARTQLSYPDVDTRKRVFMPSRQMVTV